MDVGFRSWSWAAIACLALFVRAYGQEGISDRIQRETERIAKELATGPRMKLPPLPEDEATKPPPEIIAAAGSEFVEAWNTWRLVTFLPAIIGPLVPEEPKEVVNANEEWAPFHDLLERTITANPPPKPAEYARFTYKSLDWCGDGGMGFLQLYQQGHTLALLRNGNSFPALQALATDPRSPAFDPLAQAFGLDPQELRIGRWLHKRCLPDEPCRAGGDKSAVMLLKWAELHWDREIERQKEIAASGVVPNLDEPYFPRLDLLHLLRPDNGVTDETKGRVARFIETRGLEMYPPAHWISSTPRGTEKWLVSLARRGLVDDLNAVRKRSSRLLTIAGVDHPAPEMRPDLRFRITVNGKPWPGEVNLSGYEARAPHMGFDFGKGGQAGSQLEPLGEGLFKADPDPFFEHPDFRNLRFTTLPSSGTSVNPTSPIAPWLGVTLPNPLKFDDVNEVNIETFSATIRPFIPKERSASRSVTEIEFERVHDPLRISDGSLYRYHMKGADEIVLTHVSPGEYWLRVWHPGASLMPMTKVTVDENHLVLEPELEFGASVIVPIHWPGGKRPEKLPMDWARTLAWADDETSGLFHLLELRRDGKPFPSGPLPVSAKGKFPSSAIFANLPTGRYEIVMPAQTWKADDGDPAFSVRQTSVEVIVTRESPEFLEASPLSIDLTSP